MRCAALPWVKLSGTTRPCAWRWSVSSPIASAARIPLFDVSGLQPVAVARGPDAGIAIGLQLDADLNRISLRRRTLALRRPRLIEHAGKMLDMMPHLMRDHIGLGKVAGRAEPVAKLAVEAGVEIDIVVGRAVERPHRGLRRAAARLAAAAIEDEAGGV